ncbi:hypothetical protein KDAU_07010 [Dictyobacter aurantiacus]|uniref:Uncharacterized protein n=1 Tax=Dictyobacter aurantiacus TaxID=1936993 RepID=A0A401Z945_9CHLR|nr:hypothetical protein KDAU_07010 [Dictyobacter aurantiacus]
MRAGPTNAVNSATMLTDKALSGLLMFFEPSIRVISHPQKCTVEATSPLGKLLLFLGFVVRMS